MQKGDLSNLTPPRWLITLEALTDGQKFPKKRPWNTWHDVASRVEIPKHVLGALWKFTNKTSVCFELVYFGGSWDFGVALEDVLDRRGIHPIRWFTQYSSRLTLLEELPFRGDVQAIVDLPEFMWQWGSRGMNVRSVAQI